MLCALPLNMVYAETDIKTDDFQAYAEFLSSLGITDGLSLDFSDSVSRGQFIHMIIKAMN